LLPKASNVIRVRAITELQDDGHLLAPMNLTDLVEWTMHVIPEGQKNAYAAAQKRKGSSYRCKCDDGRGRNRSVSPSLRRRLSSCADSDFDAGKYNRHFRSTRRYCLFCNASEFDFGGNRSDPHGAFGARRILVVDSGGWSYPEWSHFGDYGRSIYHRFW